MARIARDLTIGSTTEGRRGTGQMPLPPLIQPTSQIHTPRPNVYYQRALTESVRSPRSEVSMGGVG